jgi:GMP synthase-like glutamine amidotransferase
LRSLIVRFKDCEGPGILENCLKEKGYTITYHNAYHKSLQLIPEAHLVFDTIILMGGPQSVTDTQQTGFFKPYYNLVENALSVNKKVIGVCLGSQIIAKVLGARVIKGDKGLELGFSPVRVEEPKHKIFQDISSSEILAFHLHEDTFDLPSGAVRLLSSPIYENQMFSYSENVYAIQCHLEVTVPMLQVWWKQFPNIEPALGKFNPNIIDKQREMEETSRKVFDHLS